jgi:hypothetical protein
MSNSISNDSFEIDLTDFPRRGRRRPRYYEGPTDGWTAHASPYEHRLMVTQQCRNVAAQEPRSGTWLLRCETAAWAQHLTICDNCAESQARVDRENGVA